jgi:hypothetical protein
MQHSVAETVFMAPPLSPAATPPANPRVDDDAPVATRLTSTGAGQPRHPSSGVAAIRHDNAAHHRASPRQGHDTGLHLQADASGPRAA